MSSIKAYIITNLVNGKKYVGITGRDIGWRWKMHKYYALKHKTENYFMRAIRKYGPENFSIQEVAEAYSIQEASILERALIASLGTLAPKGYNSTIGGELARGKRLSLISRQKMSKSAKARFARPEELELRRQRSREQGNRPEAKIAFVARMKKFYEDPSNKENLRVKSESYYTNEENLKAHSERAKKQYADPAKKEQHRQAVKLWWIRRKAEQDAAEQAFIDSHNAVKH